MAKRSRKKERQGTIALCVSAGIIAGFGLGMLAGSVWLGTLLGALLGLAAGVHFTRRAQS